MINSAISPSVQHFIYGITDPAIIWTTLKSQLDSIDSNSGPYILRGQFLDTKYDSSEPIAVFFAKLRQYQGRLASTSYPLPDHELVSRVLSYRTLPLAFDSTLEILHL